MGKKEKTFKEAVDGIRESEKDVDRVLRAAKLQKNPECSESRAEMAFAAVALVAVFAFMSLGLLILGGVL